MDLFFISIETYVIIFNKECYIYELSVISGDLSI